MQKVRISRKKLILLSSALLLLVSAVLLISLNRDIVETVKRETARILVQEYIPNQSFEMETRDAYLQRDSIYKEFRKRYRFHFQTIATHDFSDSSKLIIISEPPPYFEVDSIKSIFTKFTHLGETKQHKIGYDGRITDLLIVVGNATKENMDNLIAKLSQQLYLSDYKPYAMKLEEEEKRCYFSKSNLDYQVSLYEFNDWFIENNEAFIRYPDTLNTLTVSEMFAQKERGVFFSKLPGFVAWAIAKKSDLSEQLEYIRQFTLDADLVLGALADSTTLVVIGREREAPLSELPPLNVESILLLASITEKELSQSLDINDLLAGKMPNGSDWCPTYLSKELENTEFGHLLTITDILLKDWSEKGTIKEAYYRYPEPGYYPFDRPLFRKLGLNQLVYNWNTANAMYAIDQDDMTIYTLNRTGALPVSYFNSQERSVSIGYRYEQQAYHYFATLGNTDLVRVVQYTALYQLFIDNQISYKGEIHTAFPKNKPHLLFKPTKEILEVLKSITDEQIGKLTDTLSLIKYAEYQSDQVEKELGKNESQYNFTYTDEQKEQIYRDVKQNTKQQITQNFTKVRSMLKGVSDEEFEKIAKYLAYPRGTHINNRESYYMMLKAKQVNELFSSIGKNHLTLMGIDLDKIKNYFVNNLSGSSARYLKTPSVIITFNDFLTTGGHNLSSKISRVNSMTNYKRSNYVPTEYSVPEKGQDDVAEKSAPTTTSAAPKPATSAPATSKPSTPSSTAKPSAPKPGTTTATKPSTTTTTSRTSAPSIRPRGEVISTASRGQRGF